MRNEDTNNQGTNVTPENGVVKKKSKKKLFIILGVVLVLIIAIGSCSSTGSKSDSNDDSSKSSFKESFEEGYKDGLSGTKVDDSEELEESKEESVEVPEESENTEESEESKDENAAESVVSEDSKDYSDADVSKSFADSYLLSDGKYLVGVDLPAGDYIIYGNNFLFDGILAGSYKIYSSSAADAKKICSKTVGNWSFISLEDGQYIDLNRCYLYDISKTDLVNTKTDGEFRVGIDIPAGEYRLRETSSLNCYSVDSGYTAYDKTVGFHMVDGQDYVTVEDGQLLDLAGCVIDEKVG